MRPQATVVLALTEMPYAGDVSAPLCGLGKFDGDAGHGASMRWTWRPSLVVNHSSDCHRTAGQVLWQLGAKGQ